MILDEGDDLLDHEAGFLVGHSKPMLESTRGAKTKAGANRQVRGQQVRQFPATRDKTMEIEQIKQAVRDRYGRFAEGGGNKESC